MTAPTGTVRVDQSEQTIRFRVEGWGRMGHGLALRRFAEQALANGATTLLVDLRHCTYMDSTFLGTLLFLKRVTDRREQGKFALISPSPECCQLLQQMALLAVFPVVTAEEPVAGDWVELVAALDDADAFKGKVVQAHQELAGLPGPAGAPFRDVVRCLSRDPEARTTE